MPAGEIVGAGVAHIGTITPTLRPFWLDGWKELVRDRRAGLVPASGQVTIFLALPAPVGDLIANLTLPNTIEAINEAPVAVIAGLDCILYYRGRDTAYGTLRTLVCRLIASLPRRLQLFDIDQERAAFLKLGDADGS